MHASNFKLIIVGNNYNQLCCAIELVLYGGSVCGWSKKNGWLCFHWSGKKDVNMFPTPLDSAGLKCMIQEWLKEQWEIENIDDPNAEWDGAHRKEGWELRCGYDAIKEVDNDLNGWSYELFRIRPQWAFYAK